jgi:hypothetical protein
MKKYLQDKKLDKLIVIFIYFNKNINYLSIKLIVLIYKWEN